MSLDDVIQSQGKKARYYKGKFRRGFNKNRRPRYVKKPLGISQGRRFSNRKFQKKYVRPIQARRTKVIYVKNEKPSRVDLSEKKKKRILKVSNLALTTSNDDIFKLFSSIGPLKRCKIRYDRLGKSIVF